MIGGLLKGISAVLDRFFQDSINAEKEKYLLNGPSFFLFDKVSGKV
jgi:hypothetical protein